MSKTYLLDTNIISYLTDSKSLYRNSVKAKLFSLSEEDKVAVSIVTLYELAYGLATFEKNKKRVYQRVFRNFSFKCGRDRYLKYQKMFFHGVILILIKQF